MFAALSKANKKTRNTLFFSRTTELIINVDAYFNRATALRNESAERKNNDRLRALLRPDPSCLR